MLFSQKIDSSVERNLDTIGNNPSSNNEQDLGENQEPSGSDLPSTSNGTKTTARPLLNSFCRKGKDLFYVMLIKNNNSLIAVKREWVEFPRSKESRFFYSPNMDDQPVFSDPMFFFKENENGCYFGRVIKYFGNFVFLYFLFR